MGKKEVQRGEIYHADLNPVFGSEQGGYRPVLIIQNNRGNRHSPTVIIAAITSRPKTKLPTHVLIRGIEGLEKESFVLLEQIRTLDKLRLEDYVGKLNREQMMKVDKALRSSTGIKKLDKPILMCLCPVCAKPFYNSKEHFIIRADQVHIVHPRDPLIAAGAPNARAEQVLISPDRELHAAVRKERRGRQGDLASLLVDRA